MDPIMIALVLKVVDIMLLGATLIPKAKLAAEKLADFLRGLDGRNPTEEEWAMINAETSALLSHLSARAEEAKDPNSV